MGRKKKSSLKIYSGYLLFKLLTFCVKRVPFRSLTSWGEKTGALGFYLVRRRRKIALNNLHLALKPEKSSEEIHRICRETFKNIGRDMMENARSDFEDGYLKALVAIEGKEHLDQALKEGKGAIAASAHFGNFPLMCTRLVREGYPFSLVVRDPENPEIARVLRSFRDMIGMDSIPDKPRMTCVSRCLKALKKNRLLMLQIDQNAPVSEAWVDFFGYSVPTFKGPIILSLRTGAPILPTFIIRNSDHSHKIVFHPRFNLDLTGNTQDDITRNLARLTKIVEATIRQHPDHWWWIHRRFKRARDVQTGKRLFPKGI